MISVKHQLQQASTNHPQTLSDLHTSPDVPNCRKTFDVRADGFERGEGVIAMRLHLLGVLHVNTRFGLLMGSSCIHKGGGASLRALRGPAIEYKCDALSNSKPFQGYFICRNMWARGASRGCDRSRHTSVCSASMMNIVSRVLDLVACTQTYHIDGARAWYPWWHPHESLM